MQTVAVEITKLVDSSFPGWVEFVLRDANGTVWTFVEKVPVVTEDNLSAESVYPRQAWLACEVLSNAGGSLPAHLVRIDTSRPWGIEAVDGTTVFTVRREQVDGAA